MTSNERPSRENEAFWHDFLSRGHSKERAGRDRVHVSLRRRPRLDDARGGHAGDGVSSAHGPLYDTAAHVVFDHDGMVDKFVGDELVAMFFPLLTGERHAAHAVDAARALLQATGHADPGGPWVPLGAGVHTGIAWVGSVGARTHTALTALGDAVNTTARLAATARAGEILVTTDASTPAGLDSALERKPLDLRGKQQMTEVVALTVAPSGD